MRLHPAQYQAHDVFLACSVASASLSDTTPASRRTPTLEWKIGLDAVKKRCANGAMEPL